jgi:hypothetical protein
MAHAARSTLAVTLFALGLIASSLVGACSGGEFSEGGVDTGSGGQRPDAGPGAGSSAGGGSGATPGGTVLCKGPDECNDVDPCTIDECGAEGTCVHAPKCSGGELCCDGVCSQCCAQEDCSDAIGCTSDTCFAGFCAHVPDDDACGTNQYCHSIEDCKDREPCPNGTPEECDDQDLCTADSCSAGYCDHDFCGSGEQCCPDVGCASCCSDSQCQDDGNLCTKEICHDGQCQSGPLCPDGKCCAGPDNATCRGCCVPQDCDDGIECTVENCLDGQCSHTADNNACGNTQICDLLQGCVEAGDCTDDGDCESADVCTKGTCGVTGSCTFSPLCPGQQCCNGVCQQCCSRDDCGGTVSANIIEPPPGGCETVSCVDGVCDTQYFECTELCCAPNGCCNLDQ